MSQIGSFVQAVQPVNLVPDLVVFYAVNSVGLFTPLAVVLLPHGVVVLALLKDLDHIIDFQFWILPSVLFPPPEIDPYFHVVLVVVGVLGFHLR